jgi:hypothetical protein
VTVIGRYDLRKEIDGTWTVFDIATSVPAEINGVPIMCLDIEEADDAIDLLNTLDIARQRRTMTDLRSLEALR